VYALTQQMVRSKGMMKLYLLSTPTTISFPHVLWWFDGGDEFEDYVAETDETDDGAEDHVGCVNIEEDRASEDVDFVSKLAWWIFGAKSRNWGGGHEIDRENLQMPLPRKENRKDA